MSFSRKMDPLLIWKCLLVLLLINYQVITIICKDFFVVKYLRDIILILLVGYAIYRNRICVGSLEGIIVVFLLSLLVPIFLTSNFSVSFLFLRRYIFPLLVFWALQSLDTISDDVYSRFLYFLLNLLTVLSIWGIFQAQVLGDSFLMSLGYPTMYSYAYGRQILNYSFYFGGLGIQRVVSTISNSNICALIFGVSILTFAVNADSLLKKRINKIKFLIICLAYLLTFSRSNFLAMGIVVLFLVWKDIPLKYKKCLLGVLGLAILMFLFSSLFSSSVLFKIWGWIVNTFSGKEDSAVGRVGIWKEAFNVVKNNPFGIGFGHVGAYGQNNGVSDFLHCENSYLAMAIDDGWIGLGLYLCIFVFALKRIGIIENIRSRRTIRGIVLYMMICFGFSNHIYDMEAVSYVYSLIAINIAREKNRL